MRTIRYNPERRRQMIDSVIIPYFPSFPISPFPVSFCQFILSLRKIFRLEIPMFPLLSKYDADITSSALQEAVGLCWLRGRSNSVAGLQGVPCGVGSARRAQGS